MSATTVIVGAGHAGVQVAASLREKGYAGRVILASEEDGLPYHRPPLSKHLLTANHAPQLLRPASFYETNRIELLTNKRACEIKRADQRIAFTDGSELSYDTLVLATGSRARAFPMPGHQLPNVLTLRSKADADRLGQLLETGQHLVVIGAGMIGLEFAAVAAVSGRHTTVIDAAPRPLLRSVSPEMAQYLRQRHEAEGVEFRFNDGVAAINGSETATSVTTLSGKTIAADLILVAAGAVANSELSQAADLECNNGVSVNLNMISTDARIYAVGDCASFPHEGTQLRLESVQNATDQARAAASSIAGVPEPYNQTPWFWSDQYDLKLQIAGLWTGYDRVVRRAGQQAGAFALYLYRNDELVCVESINSAGDHVAARKMLAGKFHLRPEQAADDTFDLKAFVRAQPRSMSTGI